MNHCKNETIEFFQMREEGLSELLRAVADEVEKHPEAIWFNLTTSLDLEEYPWVYEANLYAHSSWLRVHHEVCY